MPYTEYLAHFQALQWVPEFETWFWIPVIDTQPPQKYRKLLLHKNKTFCAKNAIKLHPPKTPQIFETDQNFRNIAPQMSNSTYVIST